MSGLYGIRDWWRRRRWKRGERFTSSEVAVIRALLPDHDRRTELLLQQALDPPGVHRELIAVNSCKVRIPYIKHERYAIDAPQEVASPPIIVKESASGRELRFTVKVLRGGFLNDLIGVAQDGHLWPLDWSVDEAQLAECGARQLLNWLPPEMSTLTRTKVLEQLAAWCDADPVKLRAFDDDILWVSPPASDDDIRLAEARVSSPLPAEYREFVRICDGIAIRHGRPYEVLGTSDAYRLDLDGVPGAPFLVVTVLYENGVVAMDAAGVTVLLGPDSSLREVIGSLKSHLHDSLCWLSDVRPT